MKINTQHLQEIKNLKGYRMYYDLDSHQILQERGGVFWVIANKGEAHSVMRGLITADQRFYRRKHK